MDLRLTFQLVLGVFSFRKGNMRFFNWKRLIVSIFLLPVFCMLLVSNRVFLLLDYIFFPWFISQKVEQPIFIVAAPRSATTYLYHSLANHKSKFTCFKLWEIIFAPSILQKYILIILNRIDSLIGSPIKRLIQFFEKLMLKKINKIHLLSLLMPEEDEAVLLWNLNSLYLNFFYPDSYFFDDYFLFDEKVKTRIKTRIMRSYRRYIQRHNFVFNRKGHRTYLSKNPLMMCKLISLQEVFPDARIININRCPKKVIPSTINLNNTIYSFFTSRQSNENVKQRTIDIIKEWYVQANNSLNSIYNNQHIKLDFEALIKGEKAEIERIEKFTGLKKMEFENIKRKKNYKSTMNYVPVEPELEKRLMNDLAFMQSYCEE